MPRGRWDQNVAYLAQDVCPIELQHRGGISEKLEQFRSFLKIRNQIIHGHVMPDMDRFHLVIDGFPKINDDNVDKIASALDEISRTYISISEFDPRTRGLKSTVFHISEVERIVADAQAVLSALSGIKQQIRDISGDVGIMMPLSEIRKMSS
jgi:hypothetical protein